MADDSTNQPPHSRQAEVPAIADRIDAKFVAAPHPALIEADELFVQCDHRFQRRSGPGGQHRNKTSSGVFLHHEPTGVTSEATERRSQADNRKEALARLRLKLATDVRTTSVIDDGDDVPGDPVERVLRGRYHAGPLRFRETNPDRPSVIALLLNDMHAAGGQPSIVAKIWGTSTSNIVTILKSHPPAFAWINAVRLHHGKGPLK